MTKSIIHHRLFFTPRYFTETIAKQTVLSFVIVLFLYFIPSNTSLNNIVFLSIFGIITLTISIISVLQRKIVNYIVIDTENKEVEIHYVKPFKECLLKVHISELGFTYETDYEYPFTSLFRYFKYKRLKINFKNELSLAISEQENTFTKEAIKDIADRFHRLKVINSSN